VSITLRERTSKRTQISRTCDSDRQRTATGLKLAVFVDAAAVIAAAGF